MIVHVTNPRLWPMPPTTTCRPEDPPESGLASCGGTDYGASLGALGGVDGAEGGPCRCHLRLGSR